MQKCAIRHPIYHSPPFQERQKSDEFVPIPPSPQKNRHSLYCMVVRFCSIRHLESYVYRLELMWSLFRGPVGKYGGEGEIRTPGSLSASSAFEAGAFNHSATSPHDVGLRLLLLPIVKRHHCFRRAVIAFGPRTCVPHRYLNPPTTLELSYPFRRYCCNNPS